MRCSRCGNDNPEQNRFCGMCGATLLAPASARSEPLAAPPVPTPIRAETTPVRTQEVPRPSAPVHEDSPSISGPSFLGLSDPRPRSAVSRSRGSLSIDPHSATRPGNVDYLLEDDEEGQGSGAWKYILILLALALAVGFGYLRWKNEGLAWLNLAAKKPSTTAQDAGSDGSSSPVPAPPEVTADSPTAAATQPSAPPTQAPNGSTTNTPLSAPAETAAGGNTAASTGAPSAAAAVPKGDDAANPASASDKGTSPSAKDSAAESGSGDAAADDASPQPAPKPKPVATTPTAKPRAAMNPVPAADPVSEARKYLYGKGAPQDCDRGMRILKPAANQANAKAMIEMGALYSAGLCAPHDLPTAYRWFAMALRKEPDNTAVQADLQKLWSEMTQPERQLAIKLSQ